MSALESVLLRRQGRFSIPMLEQQGKPMSRSFENLTETDERDHFQSEIMNTTHVQFLPLSARLVDEGHNNSVGFVVRIGEVKLLKGEGKVKHLQPALQWGYLQLAPPTCFILL